ncbi:MAG: YhbY family RNA-binding protein [Candidatus Heimdallarchaeaceae archaeon]
MKELLSRVKQEPAKLRIGKKGVTEAIIEEVENLLKRDSAVKIKCLKIIPNESIEPIAKNIAKLTHSKLVEIRGKTFILLKI